MIIKKNKLYLLKGNTAQKLPKEFPNNSRDKHSLQRLLKHKYMVQWTLSMELQTTNCALQTM